MKKTFSGFGILMGVVIVIIGLYFAFGFKDGYDGDSTTGYTFGADFYTEQYAATKHVADNVLELGSYYERVFGFSCKAIGILIAAFGGVVICYFGCRLSEEDNRDVLKLIADKVDGITTIKNDPPVSEKKDDSDEELPII